MSSQWVSADKVVEPGMYFVTQDHGLNWRVAEIAHEMGRLWLSERGKSKVLEFVSDATEFQGPITPNDGE